jgi:hypothetical protein
MPGRSDRRLRAVSYEPLREAGHGNVQGKSRLPHQSPWKSLHQILELAHEVSLLSIRPGSRIERLYIEGDSSSELREIEDILEASRS